MFQILSLSGGGYLGLYTVSLLERIEAHTGKRIIDSFDLIAGTSIGGIIALGLSAGRSAAEIKQAFLDEGHKVFSSKRPPTGALSSALHLFRGMRRARYDSMRLQYVVEQVVGSDTLVSDLQRPTIIPAVNLTKGGPKVFKTGHHTRFKNDWRLRVVDVAMATSAAPTYFPIHRIGNESFADGALVANSPDLIAVHEAEKFLGAARSNMRVLSIGTTTSTFAFSSAAGANLGIAGWLQKQRLTRVMIGSQQELTNDMMKHILEERYVRIDRLQPPDQQAELALDCASDYAKHDLQASADSSFAEVSSNSMLREILNHRAPPFTFVNASL